MDASQQEILDIFTRTRALLQGHFVLRSGLHSGHYFQCAQVCQRMDAVERLAELLLAKVRAQGLNFATVLAPAMGGLVIGQEVARQAKARYIFAEKENNVLVMRRGFTLAPGEPVLVVEDVVTRGGRVLECLEIVRQAGGKAVATVGLAMLVDRSAGAARFDVPAVSLLELSFPTYPADAVPEALAKIPGDKAGELKSSGHAAPRAGPADSVPSFSGDRDGTPKARRRRDNKPATRLRSPADSGPPLRGGKVGDRRTVDFHDDRVRRKRSRKGESSATSVMTRPLACRDPELAAQIGGERRHGHARQQFVVGLSTSVPRVTSMILSLPSRRILSFAVRARSFARSSGAGRRAW